MTLTQSRPLLGSLEIDLGEKSLVVRKKRLMNESQIEIPLKRFGTTLSYQKIAQLRWLVVGSFFLIGAVAFSVMDWGEDRPVGLIVVGILLYFALCCGFVFYRRKVDLVILHAVEGNPLLFLHRSLPSEVHVKEFISIIHERSAAARLTE